MKREKISKKMFSALANTIKAHCKECNGYTFREDCQGKSCALYPYFKNNLLTTNKGEKK